jgi:hypothetical protein
MSNLPLLGRSDLNAEQKELWDYILKGPRGVGVGESIKFLPGPFNPWMKYRHSERSLPRWGSDCGFIPNSQANTANSQS